MKLYKLTDQNGNTNGNTHWEEGMTLSLPPCDNPQLCSSDVFHAYRNINLAFQAQPVETINNFLMILQSSKRIFLIFPMKAILTTEITRHAYLPMDLNIAAHILSYRSGPEARDTIIW